jgi:four helix bundle protein
MVGEEDGARILQVLSAQHSALGDQLSAKQEMHMKDFKSLQVWEKAHALALDIYKSTASFPKEEMYGLTSQIRRASVSIPSNIAEGCGRDGDAELKRFLLISMGSASEVEYQLLLARDLNFMKADVYDQLNTKVIEIKRMLASFIKTLKGG